MQVVLFPDGDDPDSFARKVSTELADYIQTAKQGFYLFQSWYFTERARK